MKKIILSLLTIFSYTESVICGVLFEETREYNAGSNGLFTDTTYSHRYRIIHDPDAISKRKEALGVGYIAFSEDAPDETAIIQDQRTDIDSIGMTAYKIHTDKEFLYTSGVKDCIALAAFDSSGKFCLYHCSKMELRSNDVEQSAFGFFIKEFKEQFHGVRPGLFLISGCYSDDLDVLLARLKKNDVHVSGINIPDIILKEYEEIDPSGLIQKASSDLIIGGQPTKFEGAWKIPSVSILLNVQTGEIKIARS